MRQFGYMGKRSAVNLSAIALLALLGASGCQRIIVPEGYAQEREKHVSGGQAYAAPWAERAFPDLAQDSSLDRTLEYAFLSSGELESSFLEWRAAIEKVPQAGALPDPRIDFQFLFTPDLVSSFGGLAENLLRSVRLMGSQEFPARGKREAEAAKALAEAQAAAERFRDAKFRLQHKVTQTYARLALNSDLIENTSDTLRLLNQSREIALQHYHSIEMRTSADVQKAELEIDRSASGQRSLSIEQRSLKAELNGLLNRSPEAAIGRVNLPALSSEVSFSAAIERAASDNPRLAALKKEIEAKGAARTLAELQTRRDFSLGGGLDDAIVPLLSASFTLPINHERIRAGIDEAIAAQRAADARLRAETFDIEARLAMALAGIADAERLDAETQNVLIPKAEEILRSQQLQYGSGAGSYMKILDTQRLLVELRRLALQARTDRVIRAAELEELLATDLLHPPEDSKTLPTEAIR